MNRKLPNLKNRKKKILPSFRGFWDNIIRANVYSWNPRREESERLEKNIFEDKMAEKNPSNFMKNIFTD